VGWLSGGLYAETSPMSRMLNTLVEHNKSKRTSTSSVRVYTVRAVITPHLGCCTCLLVLRAVLRVQKTYTTFSLLSLNR
jgi:hypothetical protein